MAKFCGKCGNKLDETTGLCPKCAQKAPSNIPVAVQVIDDDTTLKITKKPKKSKKSPVVIVALILVVVVALSGVFGVLSYLDVINLNFGKQNTTEKSALIKTKHGDYYMSGAGAFKTNKDDSITVVKSDDSDEEQSGSILRLNQYAVKGDVAYGSIGDDRESLYRVEFTNDDVAEKSVWVDNNTLDDSCVANKSHGYSGNMRDLRVDGDYVYFVSMPSLEYLMTEQDICYRLGRISFDGSEIEFIDNEVATAYTVSDGWIYFFDNGYTYNKSKDNYEFDEDRIGLYKMKTDGSKKECIRDDFKKHDDDYREGIYEFNYCSEIEIIDGNIYYVDHSQKGKGRVCRMKTDGSDVEYLTDEGAHCYTVDLKNEKLYYATGEFQQTTAEPRKIYETSIDGDKNKEKKLFEFGIGYVDIVYDDGYLYFTNNDYFELESSLCGLKYNIDENKAYSIKNDVEYETTYVNGVIPKKEFVKNEFYWEEYNFKTR